MGQVEEALYMARGGISLCPGTQAESAGIVIFLREEQFDGTTIQPGVDERSGRGGVDSTVLPFATPNPSRTVGNRDPGSTSKGPGFAYVRHR
jgi:hypothetical protein